MYPYTLLAEINLTKTDEIILKQSIENKRMNNPKKPPSQDAGEHEGLGKRGHSISTVPAGTVEQ